MVLVPRWCWCLGGVGGGDSDDGAVDSDGVGDGVGQMVPVALVSAWSGLDDNQVHYPLIH